jgi:hypothetical protein
MMNRELRKIGSILLLLLFLFNSMGLYLIFELNKYLIRQEIKAMVDSNRSHRQITLLRIINPEHNQDFIRIESREIRYKGKLYDIIREKKEGDCHLFYCFHDVKEELLIAGFLKTQHRRFTLALLHNIVIHALPAEFSQTPSPFGTNFAFPDADDRVLLVYLTRFAPPPEIC